MDRYEVLEKIGEGTFGEVSKALDVETGEVVAIKRVRTRGGSGDGVPNTALREMRALQHLQHPNVVQLLRMFPTGSQIALVFEYMRTDLHELLRRMPDPLSDAQVKSYMLMLLRGVAHCHAHSIIHRDLKPSNLLISPSGELKIADFGLARVHREGATEPYTHQVATRWYRAPELLFGARHYGAGVDMWAVGAILAELLGHAPLFPGENDIDQIFRVVQALGAPDDSKWPGVHELPDFNKITFPALQPVPWRRLLPGASPVALSLLGSLLQYNPAHRLTAAEALVHPYFLTHPLPVEPWQLPFVDRPARASEEASTELDASVDVLLQDPHL